MVESIKRENFGLGFIKKDFIPEGKDEFYLRKEQNPKKFRNLREAEIEDLKIQNNYSDNWGLVLVQDDFDSSLIVGNRFYGLVRIGKLEKNILCFHDFEQEEGLYNSVFISCDIGNHCAINGCRYISHYIIQDNCILSEINELQTTNHSKFGNGVVKEGEDEEVRVWIDIMNEKGGRSVSPFVSMTAGDAYLWATYRENKKLMERFSSFNYLICSKSRGYYGVIEHDCVIKGCGIIKDAYFGPECYVKCANKIKNVSFLSTVEEPVQIGEGVEIVNGIVGSGSRIFYGCKAIKFVMGDNCNLKYGARLIHSILGDNSTISCCEVLNNLIYAGHEQHHNNSFLIASFIKGQSNMAAGANIGSNHNSRGNDGEIVAGRGFWPALSSTLKHNCRFASYVLITKGDYPHELNVELPFSLLADNICEHRREILGGYWWMYNMYALERNSWKYGVRDKRKDPKQIFETDYLAPDTINEIRKALFLISLWTAKSYLRKYDKKYWNSQIGDLKEANFLKNCSVKELLKTKNRIEAKAWNNSSKKEKEMACLLANLGKAMIMEKPKLIEEFEVFGEHIESSATPVLVRKVVQSFNAYREMLIYYGVRECSLWCKKTGLKLADLKKKVSASSLVDFGEDKLSFYDYFEKIGKIKWENVGGQLVPHKRVEKLFEEICNKKINNWNSIHEEYKKWEISYPEDKAIDGYLSLCEVTEQMEVEDQRDQLLESALRIRSQITEQVKFTKVKDYENFYRTVTYRNEKELNSVLGEVENDSFIINSKKQESSFIELSKFFK